MAKSIIMRDLARLTARISGVSLVIAGRGSERACEDESALLDIVDCRMASIKVKGRVPVFCAWDGAGGGDGNFMVVVYVVRMFFGWWGRKLKTMIVAIV
jgi:hypothetical protein